MSYRTESAVIIPVSTGLLLSAWFRWAPIDFTEACGFVTGAVCVWLVATSQPSRYDFQQNGLDM